MFGFSGRKSEREWQGFEQEAMPHMADLFRIAYWLVRDREEAEDLVQETFTEALKSFHRYERGTNCRAWLSTIMHHTNAKRRMKLGRLQLVEDTEEQIAETLAFEPPIPQSLTDEDVIAAVRRIPEQFSRVVVLADVEDFAYKEISAMLNVPIGTVMSRLHRGRKLLRNELAGYARDHGIKNAEAVG